jgi:hypothetical protein
VTRWVCSEATPTYLVLFFFLAPPIVRWRRKFARREPATSHTPKSMRMSVTRSHDVSLGRATSSFRGVCSVRCGLRPVAAAAVRCATRPWTLQRAVVAPARRREPTRPATASSHGVGVSQRLVFRALSGGEDESEGDELRMVYEDDDVLVIYKPTGLAFHARYGVSRAPKLRVNSRGIGDVCRLPGWLGTHVGQCTALVGRSLAVFFQAIDASVLAALLIATLLLLTPH